MKNFLNLLLLSGSALARSVLSETWDQKLDLTITSSEMLINLGDELES